MNERELYTKAIKTYGVREQSAVAMEECAELIRAINKYQRKSNLDNRMNLREEIADVQIMIEQLKIMYDIRQDDIEKIKQLKNERLEMRLEKED
ncbi:MAG: hypothetical protein IJ784_00365 [Ruminiclostridium sp.]|nr:hypothetical protein [Ruminiclostridium sp.]